MKVCEVRAKWLPKYGWRRPLAGGSGHRSRRPRCRPHLRYHAQVSASMDKMPFDMLRQGWFWSSLISLLFRKRRATQNRELVPTEA